MGILDIFFFVVHFNPYLYIKKKKKKR